VDIDYLLWKPLFTNVIYGGFIFTGAVINRLNGTVGGGGTGKFS
jgi:hypothetical protein